MQPSTVTCNDRTIDFFVLHRSIAHLVHSVHKVADAGLTPHSPVRLILTGRSRKVEVRQIKAPQAHKAILPFGPLNKQFYDYAGDALTSWYTDVNSDYNDLTAATHSVLNHIAGTEASESEAKHFKSSRTAHRRVAASRSNSRDCCSAPLRPSCSPCPHELGVKVSQ